MSARLEQITQLYNQYRRLRNETISLTGQFADEQWWISRKDMQAINSAYGLARDGELAPYLSVDMDILLEEMEICCNVCDSTGRLAGRTQAVYTTFKTAETVCTVASAAGGVAVIGKEAAKLGLKRGAVYVAKQAAAIAATQAGMTVVVHPLAQKYGISETQLRAGLAAVQALTMYKAFTKTGPKPKCVSTSQGKKGGESHAAKIGRQAHKAFKQKVKAKPRWQSEPALIDPKTGKTVIPDALSPSGRPVELKPRTPSGKRTGKTQLRKYERATGKKGRVVYYDPENPNF
jgi:hypothetical protein